MQTKNNKSEAGFTLIETAIVIMILSLVITPLFVYLTQQAKRKAVVKEEAVNERVIAALAQFVKDNGRFPCPADPALAADAVNFGVEDCSGTDDPIHGDLPVNTLGLPFQLAANTNNWKYIYAVTRPLTINLTAAGNVQIDTNPASAGAEITNARFAVVNLGPEGVGGTTLSGTAGAPCSDLDADAEENCNGDNLFADRPFGDTFPHTLTYTMAREQSTMWLAQPDPAGGGLNIINRNIGSVVIGDPAVAGAGLLAIGGGNVDVRGGDVETNQNVRAGQNVEATQNVIAGGEARAPTFVYTP